jgi:hypothetical protein
MVKLSEKNLFELGTKNKLDLLHRLNG